MAKIKKIQESGETIYPATITQAIKDAETGELLNEIMAKKDGKYEGLTAGFAENIVGDGSSTEEVISFRPTAGENRNTLNEGAARIAKLKGNSVVWNQQCNRKWAISKNNDSDSPQSSIVGGIGDYVKTLEGHKVYMVATSTSNSGITFYLNLFQSININGAGAIFTYTNPDSAYVGLYATIPAQTEINTEVTLLIHDLTQMFGAGNEPNTVEQFYSMLPVGVDINAYSAGEIVDGHYGAIKTTVLNQWDEQWEVGAIDGATGNEAFNNSAIRSKGYIRVIAGAKYNIKCPSQVILCAYDEDYNYIGWLLWGGSTTTFTIPVNAKYIRFGTYGAQYGPTYNNDICINLSWETEYGYLNGTYQPYKPFERDLSWIKKYFPNGMRSAGTARDEIRFNSTTQKWEAVQNVGVVDLGSLDWFIQNAVAFVASVPNKKIGSLQTTSECANNTKESFYFSSVSNYNKDTLYCSSGNANIYVVSSTNTDAAAFKAAMAGVMLNYELDTPVVTEIEENVNFDFDCSDYGTEELLVAEGAQSAPICADIVYAPNALSTIKNVPDIFTRLAALEAALATLQASVVANTNEE